MEDDDKNKIDTVDQSKKKGVQFCADTIVMVNRALSHDGVDELTKQAEKELRVIMLGELGARYWEQDVEDAKRNSAAVLDALTEEIEKEGNAQ